MASLDVDVETAKALAIPEERRSELSAPQLIDRPSLRETVSSRTFIDRLVTREFTMPSIGR
jgi:hypothetical protein